MIEFLPITFLLLITGWISSEVGYEKGKQEGRIEYYQGKINCQDTIDGKVLCIKKENSK